MLWEINIKRWGQVLKGLLSMLWSVTFHFEFVPGIGVGWVEMRRGGWV